MVNLPPIKKPPVEPDEAGKNSLYGRYQKQGDQLADLHVQQVKKDIKFLDQMKHKALDEPYNVDADAMGDINVNKEGIQSEDLAKIAKIALPLLLGVGTMGGAGLALGLLSWFSDNSNKNDVQINNPPTQQQLPVELDKPDLKDIDTVTVPKLDWGPERE